MIDNLNARFPSLGVAWLYSDYRNASNQTLVNILGSFLRQFLTSLPHIPGNLQARLEDIRKKYKSLETTDALDMLKHALQELEGSFICIDALDELEPNTRRQLLEKLKELSIYKSNRHRLFLTGREHIKSEIHGKFNVPSKYEVEITASIDDIRKFLLKELAEDINPGAMDKQLEGEIVEELSKRSQGMYVRNLSHACIYIKFISIGSFSLRYTSKWSYQ